MNNEYYVYAYLREDKTPYYIGKGKGNRAWTKGKNEIGKPIDIGRIIILKDGLSDSDAKSYECELISQYGRIDIGTGILRNKTPGGDGNSMSGSKNPMYGKTGENHHLYGKERLDMKGENNWMFGVKGEEHPAYGYKHTDEDREIIRQSKTGVKRINFDQSGSKNPMYGRTGDKNPMYGVIREKKPCPDCGTMASNSMLIRWHLGGKCKNRMKKEST